MPTRLLEETDWHQDAKELGFYENEYKLTSARNWMKQEKRHFCVETTKNNQDDSLDASKLNFKQKRAYDVVTKWITKKLKNPKGCDPLYLNIAGRGGFPQRHLSHLWKGPASAGGEGGD